MADKVPFTGGTRRSVVDAVIYVLYLASLAVAIAMPGVKDYPHPVGNGGVVNHYLMIAPIILLIILGLRDKVAFRNADAASSTCLRWSSSSFSTRPT